MRQLILWHRYLGITLSVLFAMWIISGVAMMYVRMPILFPEERFAYLAPFDPAAVAVSPADAARRAGLQEPPRRMRLASLSGRPVYYLLPRAERRRGVYADDGAPVGSRRHPAERGWTADQRDGGRHGLAPARVGTPSPSRDG
jgi:hypothetical protein